MQPHVAVGVGVPGTEEAAMLIGAPHMAQTMPPQVGQVATRAVPIVVAHFGVTVSGGDPLDAAVGEEQGGSAAATGFAPAKNSPRNIIKTSVETRNFQIVVFPFIIHLHTIRRKIRLSDPLVSSQ